MCFGQLAKIHKRPDWPEIELFLHLSPGTPAMAAVWLLLGKTRCPAAFFETFTGRSWVTEILFDTAKENLLHAVWSGDGPSARGSSNRSLAGCPNDSKVLSHWLKCGPFLQTTSNEIASEISRAALFLRQTAA